MNKTVEYYNKNAKEFCDSTFHLNMSGCQNRFLNYLPNGALILDAGCGSGRDSIYFLSQGYQVEAFDASEEICKIASANIGQVVKCIGFEAVACEAKFEGIWACASLLHVSRRELPQVMQQLHRALKTQGVIYASFKYGESDVIREDRRFSNFTEISVKELLEGAGFMILECFITSDVRAGRSDETWVNVIGKIEVKSKIKTLYQ